MQCNLVESLSNAASLFLEIPNVNFSVHTNTVRCTVQHLHAFRAMTGKAVSLSVSIVQSAYRPDGSTILRVASSTVAVTQPRKQHWPSDCRGPPSLSVLARRRACAKWRRELDEHTSSRLEARGKLLRRWPGTRSRWWSRSSACWRRRCESRATSALCCCRSRAPLFRHRYLDLNPNPDSNLKPILTLTLTHAPRVTSRSRFAFDAQH